MELGAGARAQPGWLALDVNPRTADVVADARALPFRDRSIEALRAVDVLEHITYRETDRTLAEWARVCAPGASLYVQVPDAREIARWYLTNDERLTRYDEGACAPAIGAAWRLLGGHADGRFVSDEDDWRWNAHYALFDRQYLTGCLEWAGFLVKQCPTNGHPNLCCTAVRR